MPAMSSVLSLLAPGGLLVLASLTLLRPEILPASVLPAFHLVPALALGVGILLGWYFNRSRVVFALLVLAAADLALRLAGAGGSAEAARGLLALLLPLNLAGYALLDERGLLTRRGLARLAPIPGQVLGVGLVLWGAPGMLPWLTRPILDARFTAWTDLSQAALAAFAATAGLLAVRCAAPRASPIDAGFLWALVAAFFALHGIRRGWAPTPFLATGGLILIWGLLAASYRMAFHDDLTGLPGRRALNEALPQLGRRYAVAMVDVDHFKKFNDTYGHEVGDQVLRMVAARLAHVSGGGRAFRYGGEEFSVLFPGKSAEEALPHLEALRRAIALSRFALRGPGRPRRKPENAPAARRGARREVSVTVSIGVAEPDDRQVEPAEVLQEADRALYRAKHNGRNRVEASWS
jgi:diguanylate cyclase (GGDEF)-like protein